MKKTVWALFIVTAIVVCIALLNAGCAPIDIDEALPHY
jgi:hypothetical protein